MRVKGLTLYPGTSAQAQEGCFSPKVPEIKALAAGFFLRMSAKSMLYVPFIWRTVPGHWFFKPNNIYIQNIFKGIVSRDLGALFTILLDIHI
jgi:hypothetical protein